ncbi:hypothetical protein HCJ46_17145, partial [Listeria booriae]|uniref:hypothetical protein n=1 Tax=Listeria booriae TaxID=1552123 RepID=UPI00162A0B0A
SVVKARAQFAQFEEKEKMFVQSSINYLKEINPEFIVHAESITLKERSEYIIRLANKVKELNSHDFVTVINAHETELLFADAQKLVNGNITYDNVIRTQGNIIKGLNSSTSEGKLAWGKKSLTKLLKISDFLEGRAVAELKKAGYDDLVDRYAQNGQKTELIRLYDSYVSIGNVSPEVLEKYARDSKLVDRSRNLVRGKLTSQSLNKKIQHMENWQKQMMRQLQNAPLENREKIQDNLKIAVANQETLIKTKTILYDRVQERVEALPELKETYSSLQAKLPISDLRGAYVSLYDEKLTSLNSQELFSKAVIIEKETQIEQMATQEFYRKNATYDKINVIHDSLLASIHNTSISQINSKLQFIDQGKLQLEDMWKTKERLDKKIFLSKSDRQTLSDTKGFFEAHNITAKTLSGAMKYMNYDYISTANQLAHYKQIVKVKLPLAETYLQVKENQALRFMEENLGAKNLLKNADLIGKEDKAVFVKAYESLKDAPLSNHTEFQKIVLDAPYYTELKNASESASIAVKLANSIPSNNIISQAIKLDELVLNKEKIQNEITELRNKSQMDYKSFDKIANKAREAEKEAFDKAQKVAQTKTKLTGMLKKLAKSQGTAEMLATEAEKNKEHKKRMQSIKRSKLEQEDELQLEQKMKS